METIRPKSVGDPKTECSRTYQTLFLALLLFPAGADRSIYVTLRGQILTGVVGVPQKRHRCRYSFIMDQVIFEYPLDGDHVSQLLNIS